MASEGAHLISQEENNNNSDKSDNNDINDDDNNSNSKLTSVYIWLESFEPIAETSGKLLLRLSEYESESETDSD